VLQIWPTNSVECVITDKLIFVKQIKESWFGWFGQNENIYLSFLHSIERVHIMVLLGCHYFTEFKEFFKWEGMEGGDTRLHIVQHIVPNRFVHLNG